MRAQAELTQAAHSSFETFGSYLLLKRLAAGGMAEVFLARPAQLDGNGRVQVIKRILPHVANNPMFLDMFQSEIQVILGFNHPNTVQLHDCGQVFRQPFIAMEYIEGKNLRELVAKAAEKGESLPVPMTLSLVAQAASGLGYAHTHVNKVTGKVVNAIHRDVSPHNLIVSYDGNLKVIDFGIAKAASGMEEATRTGTIKGKMAYMSPEQVNGQHLDARSDIFSLAIVAWELLTLSRAFVRDGDSDVAVIQRIHDCDRHLVAPSSLNKQIPVDLDAVIMKALKKNPEERYASAKDFQIALREVMQKHYPSYSYADTGKWVSSLFETEIRTERQELRELNLTAQNSLVAQGEAITLVTETGFGGTGSKKAPGGEHMDARLFKLESMMKQKASRRHYVLMAFYLIAVVAIQMEGRYSVINWLFPVPDQVSSAVSTAGAKKSARNNLKNKSVGKKKDTKRSAASM